ncbi:MAG: type II toxin-antitoxin system RelB/DinJ family antitoxin [Candidatus Accumulibacter sp.]|nr:type II toxin-antitoxin system RelB/DinJ family antitoxin [Accumulibacter sp.]
MAQTILTVRMERKVKEAFDAFCAEVGMNASVAVNLFAKTVIRERRIPFEIAASTDADPFFNIANQERLSRSLAQLNAGKGTAHEPIELEDA